jgi:hypothetical protein
MKTILTIFISFFICFLGIAQNSYQTSSDQSVVYFVRTLKGGAEMIKSAQLFDHEEVLGMVTYRTFIKLEFEPGKHLFWTMKSDLNCIPESYNRAYIEADLEAGKTYLIEITMPNDGIAFHPIDPVNDLAGYQRIKEVLNNKSSNKANRMNEKRDYFIEYITKYYRQMGLEKYSKYDENDKVAVLYPEWFIEDEDLITANKKNADNI